jgi:hypothetical protein
MYAGRMCSPRGEAVREVRGAKELSLTGRVGFPTFDEAFLHGPEMPDV